VADAIEVARMENAMAGILIVEDEFLERKELYEQLSAEFSDQQILVAESCDEAIAAIKREAPKIILLDIMLKGVSGFEVVKFTKREYPDTEIMIVTAYNEFDFAHMALSMGISEYLLKPVRPGVLNDKIRKMLARKRENRPGKLQVISEEPSGKNQIDNPVILKMVQMVDTCFSKDLSLNKIARDLYMNPIYLSRLFKLQMGCSFKDYLIKVRIENAKALLLDRVKSISEIAYLSGYSNANYFSNAFKNYEGCSPANYRRKMFG
jgi:two-component system response regulator YesN